MAGCMCREHFWLRVLRCVELWPVKDFSNSTSSSEYCTRGFRIRQLVLTGDNPIPSRAIILTRCWVPLPLRQLRRFRPVNARAPMHLAEIPFRRPHHLTMTHILRHHAVAGVPLSFVSLSVRVLGLQGEPQRTQ